VGRSWCPGRLTCCLNSTLEDPEVGGGACSKTQVLSTRLHGITFLYTAIFTGWFVPHKYQQQSTVTHRDPAMATTRGTHAGICQMKDYFRLKKDAAQCSAQCPLLLRSYSYDWRQNLWGFVTNVTVKCRPAGPWSKRQERIKHTHSSVSVGLLATAPLYHYSTTAIQGLVSVSSPLRATHSTTASKCHSCHCVMHCAISHQQLVPLSHRQHYSNSRISAS